MALSPTRRTQIQDRLNKLILQETQLYVMYENSLANGGVSSYRFESAEGMQSVVRKSSDSILSEIERVQKLIDYNTRLLNGTGIVSLNNRRY